MRCQHKIAALLAKFDMTVAEVFPFPGEFVVVVMRFQGQVISKQLQDDRQIILKGSPVTSFALSLVIALELACPLNLPHLARQSDL